MLVLALSATESTGTDALEVIHPVHALSPVATGKRLALVNVHAAVLAREPGTTITLVVVVQGHTTAAIRTRLRQANVHLSLAFIANVTGHALAPESVHQVHTSAAIEAGTRTRCHTIVFVKVTPVPGESHRALALETTSLLIDARSAVVARIRVAVIHLHITVSSCIAFGASTPKTLRRVRALAVQAGLLRAHHCLLLAVPSDPPLVAFATKGRGAVLQLHVMARRSVHARLLLTVGDLSVAIGPHESRLALTRVRALARVEAGAAVLAGFVVRAVVQILVAEETAPAFVALALPGFLAGAVHAARIGFAFCAEGALPAGVATEMRGGGGDKLIIEFDWQQGGGGEKRR